MDRARDLCTDALRPLYDRVLLTQLHMVNHRKFYDSFVKDEDGAPRFMLEDDTRYAIWLRGLASHAEMQFHKAMKEFGDHPDCAEFGNRLHEAEFWKWPREEKTA